MCKVPVPPPKPSFLSRYSLTLTIIPVIVGCHYGWWMLQQNRTLVTESEQIDLPVVTFAKYCYKELLAKTGAAAGPATTPLAEPK